MSVLSCSGISLSYGADVILEDVGFSLNAGAKLGVIGANGAGKSTLLKLISGALSPDSGTVTIAKGKSLGSLEQYTENSFRGKTVSDIVFEKFSALTELEKELKALESRLSDGGDGGGAVISSYTSLRDKFQSLGGYEYRGRVLSAVKRLGFTDADLSLRADSLSGGQKTRLSLSALLLSSPDIVLLDEPTNHLDTDAAAWLEEQIRCSGATFVIVSHDRYFLDRTTDCTLELENAHARFYTGAYSEFREKKKKLSEDYSKHYELQQKEIARLEAFIQNQKKWNRERNIRAAESREKAIERMDKLEKPTAAPAAIDISVSSNRRGGYDVLSVRRLTKGFGEKVLFSGLSFELKKGDRLFVTGANGTGKSTLLKLINGVLQPDSGFVEFGYAQLPGYYDQEQMLLDERSDVIGELWSAYPDMTQTQLRKALARYGFRGDEVFKSVSKLSGGERARLSIARLVLTGCSLLILDEPTNYLDIPSKEVLEDALAAYDGTLLCVSHDRYFIASLATRILEIAPSSEGGWRLFNCPYADYLAARTRQTKTEKAEKTEKPVSDGALDYSRRRKEKSDRSRREKRRLYLEGAVEAAEKRLAEIEKLTEENATDYIALQKLEDERKNLDAQLLRDLDELLTYID